MSALIVYFSFEGNTKFIAEQIAKTIHADSIALTTKKKYPDKGLGKYLWGGKSVLLGEKPELTNGPVELGPYETLLLGTPVWAGAYASPMKTFLSQCKVEGKRVALFACHGGGGAEKCFHKLKEALPNNEFIGEMEFFEPKRTPEESAAKAVKWASGLAIR